MFENGSVSTDFEAEKSLLGVLVAISIPIFTSQLEKSREATDVSNVRSAVAQVTANYLANGSTSGATVTAKQKVATWEMGSDKAVVMQQINGVETPTNIPAKASGGTYSISISNSGKIDIK